ncbi:MAG: hypothetical protein FWF59_04795 [Turicibacter sp.]|nr:hypothetical protein [Turicibacter sp.]
MHKLMIFVVFVLSLSFFVDVTTVSAYNKDNTRETDMSYLEVLSSAAIFLNIDTGEGALLSPGVSEYQIIRLYNLDDEVVAFYVRIADNFAVINNNRYNPAMIEMGEGGNPLIEEILSSGLDFQIVYNNPFEVINVALNFMPYNASEIFKGNTESFHENFSDILDEDLYLKGLKQDAKIIIIENNSSPSQRVVFGSADWGFMDLSGLPTGTVTSASSITGISGSWARTGDFLNPPKVDNHCGSVAVTNLALIFSRRSGNSNLVYSTIASTFNSVHAIVGNGPKVTIAGNAVTFFKNRGFILNHTSISSSEFTTAIAASDRPIGMLTQRNLEAHWIIGIGYRTIGGVTYYRILDGWNNSNNRFFRPGTGSAVQSRTAYYL